MIAVPQILEKSQSHRWWISIPFIIALFVLGFILWIALRVVIHPYDGIGDIHPTGRIGELVPGSPSYGILQENDLVISVDGVLWSETLHYYIGKRGGEQVSFKIERCGEIIPVSITLVDPPFFEIIIRLVPLLVALIFWGIGIGVETFKPSGSAADIFFAWCQVSALTLAAGVASYLGPFWASQLFNILLWFLGPLSVHFHLFFPQRAPEGWRRITLPLLYSLGVVGSVPNLLWGYSEIRSLSLYPLYTSSVRLFLASNLLLVVLLLYYNYRNPAYPGARGKIRIVALGGGVTAIPIVTLTILPDALLQQPIIIYPLAFLLLGILPLTYGYAIFRLHLIEIETHVNRGATFILVYSILTGFYLFFYAAFQRWFPENITSIPWINTIIVLLLVTLFTPLKNQVQRFVDTVFYGGWYDYRSGISEMTLGLEQITDLKSLAENISSRLVSTLRLEESCVFLRDIDGDFSVIEVASQSELGNSTTDHYPVLPRTSLTYLLKIGAIERSTLRKQLTEVTLTPQELQLLNSEQIHLWVPVIGHGLILGLLALGPKIGGDVFSGEDLDILRILARQMGPVIENIHLVTQLRQHAADLEERVKNRTAELFDAKERVEAILASVGEGVYVTDLEGKIITVNAAFEKQVGFSAKDIINKNHRDFLDDSNDPELIAKMLSTLTNGEVWSGELVHQRKDSDPYDIQLTIAPVCDQHGKVVSYVGSQRDITRQKELDHLKDLFVSDVSHELRTPTANINLYLELLENAPPQKRQKYMVVIREQSQLLTKLVEDILDLSRLAMVKARKIKFEPMDLNSLTEQVINVHKPLASASGLDLRFSPSSDLPLIMGDEIQMSRVITNLVSNAVRYTPEGSIDVRIYKSNNKVCLEVCDTGLGIERDDIPHIFERFYRGRYIRQSKIHGTGLGLAIVKEIVELHEGRVDVSSERGKGTTFLVSLPVDQ